jgi:hypothetical protein
MADSFDPNIEPCKFKIGDFAGPNLGYLEQEVYEDHKKIRIKIGGAERIVTGVFKRQREGCWGWWLTFEEFKNVEFNASKFMTSEEIDMERSSIID